jgi:hypothetical protein
LISNNGSLRRGFRIRSLVLDAISITDRKEEKRKGGEDGRMRIAHGEHKIRY